MPRTLALALLVTLVACGSGGGGSASKATTSSITAPPATGSASQTTAQGGASATAFALTSSAFADGGAIPVKYTCDGASVSPPLAWSGVPAGTAALALRVQDIDTPQQLVHWLVYDFPPSITSMATGQAPPGARQATNSFAKTAYAGPCPPAGSKHRYVFTMLAMQTQVNVPPTANATDVWATLERSGVTATAALTGTYQRPGH